MRSRTSDTISSIPRSAPVRPRTAGAGTGPGNGYREYDESAVERAKTIQALFAMDFPREVVHTVLACTGDAAPAAHDALAEQLHGVRSGLAERIERLTEAHRQVSAFLEQRGASDRSA